MNKYWITSTNQSLLNAPRHNRIELLLWYQPINIKIGPFEHLNNLLLLDLLPQLSRHFLQPIGANEPTAVTIKQPKNLAEMFPRLHLTHLVGHQPHPFVKGDYSIPVGVEIADHLEDGVVAGGESEGDHGLF